MKKIRLNVDALRVESFRTEAGNGDPAGTVRAHESGSDCGSDVSNCMTGWGAYTCRYYGSCDPYMECEHTGNLPTCNYDVC
ncbi:hypothetical protein [Longimicrobium sp.]|uniref:hypothetical protein n=1 Tax=Longimicrobium sp. TaxID=2029185 RepID=UPI003B3B9915